MKNLSKTFTKIYPKLKEYSDKLPKRNVQSDDLLSDLYIHLSKLEDNSKITEENLMSFCIGFLYNSNLNTKRDLRNKYNNNIFSNIDDRFDLGCSFDEDEEELSPELKKQQKALKMAYRDMDADMRLMYHYYFECNYTINREIADILGRSVGDIQKRVKRMIDFIHSYYNNTYQTRILCEEKKK